MHFTKDQIMKSQWLKVPKKISTSFLWGTATALSLEGHITYTPSLLLSIRALAFAKHAFFEKVSATWLTFKTNGNENITQ